MIRLVMESANLAHWPAMSLVLFFVFSLGTLAWVYRSGSSDTYNRLGRLALEDGEPIQKLKQSHFEQASGSMEVG